MDVLGVGGKVKLNNVRYTQWVKGENERSKRSEDRLLDAEYYHGKEKGLCGSISRATWCGKKIIK